MNEHMVERWNAVVRPDDKVYHLGDVVMQRGSDARVRPFLRIIQRLHGHKRLVLGNHDHCKVTAYLEAGFQKIYGVRLVDGWWLTHIPIDRGSMGRARGNIHGHVHANPSPDSVMAQTADGPRVKHYVNVSVENIAYTPVLLDDITARYASSR